MRFRNRPSAGAGSIRMMKWNGEPGPGPLKGGTSRAMRIGDADCRWKPDAVIFDFDGVIVDTEPLHFRAVRRVLEPLGIGIAWPQYQDRYMGLDDRDAFREAFRVHGKALDEETLKDLLTVKSLAFQDTIRDGVRPYPGVISLAESLHALGFPLAICSGALRSDIAPILTRLSISRCFPLAVTADDVRRSKPDPESYRLAFTRLRQAYPSRVLSAGACLAVEDTPAGIRSAKLSGLKVLAVTNSYGRKKLAEADYLTDSLENVRLP
jgi:beta-phosphoglucomutase